MISGGNGEAGKQWHVNLKYFQDQILTEKETASRKFACTVHKNYVPHRTLNYNSLKWPGLGCVIKFPSNEDVSRNYSHLCLTNLYGFILRYSFYIILFNIQYELH